MAHGHSQAVKDPGPYSVGSLKTVFAGLAALGALAFAAALRVDVNRAWAAFLQNHFFFMSFAIGGLFLTAIHWITGAMWSSPIRRIYGAFTSYLPFVVIFFGVLVVFGIPHVFKWSDAAFVASETAVQHKAAYLNVKFFAIRNFVALGLWLLFAKVMVGNSLAQDATKDFALAVRNKALSPAFLIVFALTYTMSSFDLLMSLDPTWFSTIFGVYCFAGLFYSTIALTCLVTLYLKAKGPLEGIVNDNHLHDLGKWMFAFSVFWAYIGFSQFMLIWYANLPEETQFFLHRFHGGWMAVSIFLLVGKFMLPFFVLLPRDAKRNPKILKSVGVFMLVAQWIDLLWVIQPEFFSEGPRVGWIEIGTSLGFLGLFGLMVSRFIGRHNVVAIGDPRLAESVHHHHQ